MGRHSCCVKQKLRKGLWSPEEDEKLFNYITQFGVGCWSSVPKLAGLQRCGKSCRLRWINYLRPDLKRGVFSQQEEDLIMSLHEALGNRWAQIATQLPGRTDNEIKNFWNSSLKKKLMKQGIDPNTHKPISENEVEDEKNCIEKSSSFPLPQFKEPEQAYFGQNSSSSYYECGVSEASREDYMSRPVFDPHYSFGFQSSIDQIGYNSIPSTQFHQRTFNHFDHNRYESNSNFGYNSLPSIANLDHGSISETDFSDNSSRMSSFIFNEAKESSSNSSNINSQNIGFKTYSWEADNKLESMFQFQHGEIKTEEMIPSSSWNEEHVHNHNSHDYSSYQLTSFSEDLTGTGFDIFNQI